MLRFANSQSNYTYSTSGLSIYWLSSTKSNDDLHLQRELENVVFRMLLYCRWGALSLAKNNLGRRHLAAKAVDWWANVGGTSAKQCLAIDIQPKIGRNRRVQWFFSLCIISWWIDARGRIWPQYPKPTVDKSNTAEHWPCIDKPLIGKQILERTLPEVSGTDIVTPPLVPWSAAFDLSVNPPWASLLLYS